jgi:hypothetical protein
MKEILMSRFALALVISLVFLVAATGAEAVLYDIDFNSPPHEVNQPPAVGGGPPPRTTISEITHGEPLVVAAVGPLDDQPLSFDSSDGGDQIMLDLSDLPPSDTYQFTARLTLGGMQPNGTFTILFDTPAIRSVVFRASGEVEANVPGVYSRTIGSYVSGLIVDLRVDIDLAADYWRIYLDGAAAHAGSFGGATALTHVRIGTNVSPDPPIVVAAIDDIVITGTPLPLAHACEVLDFEDLAAGLFHSAGVVLATGGVFIEVAPMYVNTGVCDGQTISNFARVGTDGAACGDGRELDLVNVNLAFDFNGPVTDVVIPFGEYGSLINLAINGDCRSLPEFSLLDGQTLGGVDIEVRYVGLPGDGCGTLILRGEITSLMIGGQDVAFDNIGYCRACPNEAVTDFEDLVLGNTWHVGDTFTTGFAEFTVQPFYLWAGCNNPVSDGAVSVWNAGTAAATVRTSTSIGSTSPSPPASRPSTRSPSTTASSPAASTWRSTATAAVSSTSPPSTAPTSAAPWCTSSTMAIPATAAADSTPPAPSTTSSSAATNSGSTTSALAPPSAVPSTSLPHTSPTRPSSPRTFPTPSTRARPSVSPYRARPTWIWRSTTSPVAASPPSSTARSRPAIIPRSGTVRTTAAAAPPAASTCTAWPRPATSRHGDSSC